MSARMCSDQSCSQPAQVRLVAVDGNGRAFHTLSCDRHRGEAAAASRAIGLEVVRVVHTPTPRLIRRPAGIPLELGA